MSQHFRNGIGRSELPKESNGAVAINIQDQNTPIVSSHFHCSCALFSLVNDLSIGDTSFTAVEGHGIIVGNMIYFKQNGRRTEFECTAVDTNIITLDGPVDYAYTTDAKSTKADHDLSVAGSLAVPKVFHITPPSGVKWDIVKIQLFISDETVMDDGKFGGMTALTNGVQLRQKNGAYYNIFNFKTNGDIAEHFDTPPSYSDKAPAGEYGLRAKRTFGGASGTGVTIRLDGDTDDEMQLLIQDDLTELLHFHIVAQGHVVGY